ncbi:unnamed protein product [Paramecium sonneborni]|uniref:PX domain-containing protein n=1 Tax=Paramecium sonneborni TaxID=65129 RepID=A0A8S1KEU8_9CILI|nr:unnamed protein product [Paramecium sonneborni]
MLLVNESINVTIPSYKQESSNVQYVIEIKTRNKQQWLITKRYSQFEDLHKKLILIFQDLPELPKKAFITFLVGKSKEQLEERRAGLEKYLQLLIVRREIYHSNLLRDFLQLEQCEEIIPPNLIHSTKTIMGIRDVSLSDQGVMFLLQADMSVLNRVDAYVNNMKMPWNDEETEVKTIPVGLVECYIKQEEGEFSYKRLWTKEYNTQAICMFYEPITCTLLIGLDSGNINFIKVSEKDSFQKYEQSIEIEIHISRIMGLFYRNGQIHSVSKDTHYKVIDMDQGGLKSDFSIGKHELTFLTYNEQRKISVVGNRNGQLYILNIKPVQPIVMLSVDTNTSFIRGLVLDYQKNYLISVSYDDGVICVLDVGKCLQDNIGKIKTKIQAKIKTREVQWSSKRGELFIGNDDGTVTIYNALDLQPQYVLKAHEKAITKLIWQESTQILITGGKDEFIKWWHFPKKWKAGDQDEQAKSKQLIEAKMENILKLQNQNQKIDSDEEDETGLGNWHK